MQRIVAMANIRILQEEVDLLIIVIRRRNVCVKIIKKKSYLKITILRKTTASIPPQAKMSSSVAVQAFKIQLAEGTNF